MAKPLQSNLTIHRALDARRRRLLGNYISNIKTEDIDLPKQKESTTIKIPKFKTPEVRKFEPIQIPKIEPKEYKPLENNNSTLDDFEREYQAFIEKLKKEKEKKELKEELKAYCREYINELLGIEQEQPVEEEPQVEEPEDIVVDEPLFADVDEETTPEEPRNFEEEYQDFINTLKQTKKRK